MSLDNAELIQGAGRVIVFDTETTGMNMGAGGVHIGHRVIEIGCIELINRRPTGRTYHVYIKPDRLVDPEAIAVHGITDEFLQDKPSFATIADEFIAFIVGAELVAHNASFDTNFLDHEFRLLNKGLPATKEICKITDTLAIAKKLFPGKRNNLDVLCTRYGIDNSHRTLHGALLDAEILADVYLFMTGGQTKLNLSQDSANAQGGGIRRVAASRAPLKVVQATDDELKAHDERLGIVGDALWQVH
ncbi:MAG: DNA polymerase III subunit epsilon [Moritella sp.]|uniref:DNA polymerase III subunit epsilon n=1 Tax=Moritella sp. TaxID=78556 RepID=UPI0025EF2F6C|nr:DNA polymerase III subunit epsilon [Moritella sp.]NQZ92858.1 DNA polymerase III subunit epsilon [Moritella sp.]